MSRLSQFGLHTGLLLALFLRVGLALFGPDSASFDPTHSHIVLGARTADEVSTSLAAHEHKSTYTHWHDPITARSLPLEADGAAHVVSLLSQLDSMLTALLLLALPVTGLLDPGGLLGSIRVTRPDLGPSTFEAVRSFRPPAPPPRSVRAWRL